MESVYNDKEKSNSLFWYLRGTKPNDSHQKLDSKIDLKSTLPQQFKLGVNGRKDGNIVEFFFCQALNYGTYFVVFENDQSSIYLFGDLKSNPIGKISIESLGLSCVSSICATRHTLLVWDATTNKLVEVLHGEYSSQTPYGNDPDEEASSSFESVKILQAKPTREHVLDFSINPDYRMSVLRKGMDKMLLLLIWLPFGNEAFLLSGFGDVLNCTRTDFGLAPNVFKKMRISDVDSYNNTLYVSDEHSGNIIESVILESSFSGKIVSGDGSNKLSFKKNTISKPSSLILFNLQRMFEENTDVRVGDKVVRRAHFERWLGSMFEAEKDAVFNNSFLLVLSKERRSCFSLHNFSKPTLLPFAGEHQLDENNTRTTMNLLTYDLGNYDEIIFGRESSVVFWSRSHSEILIIKPYIAKTHKDNLSKRPLLRSSEEDFT